jgi:hypothetical protein
MKTPLILPIALCLLLGGCRHKSGPNNLPIVVDKNELNALKALIADYRANPAHVTRETRNNLAERLLGVSDDHYIQLKNSLLNSRNSLSFFGEVTATTLSAVSALLGDVDTKSIVSTASTLTQSTKTSIDKNFFANNSTNALVGKMDADRATIRQTITTNEGADLSDYGFEAALNDIRKYDDAGTVTSALISLAADASSQKKTAEKNLNDMKMSIK